MKIAISYTRFSSDKQKEGVSQVRQDEGFIQWCLQNSYTADTSIRYNDKALSGYHGRNVEEGGALYNFIQGAKNGVIAKGTTLVVESFDRLSRMPANREPVGSNGRTCLSFGLYFK